MSHACSAVCLFQSTLPTRGSDKYSAEQLQGAFISIHAPHEGERQFPSGISIDNVPISIHAPHEGERPLPMCPARKDISFQSTLPTRGSDGLELIARQKEYHFNPRSPRGGATVKMAEIESKYPHFNPRSPRGGATLSPWLQQQRVYIFQSTLPTRGSDEYFFDDMTGQKYISIHAPHEGERLRPFAPVRFAHNFNPRSPRGGATSA